MYNVQLIVIIQWSARRRSRLHGSCCTVVQRRSWARQQSAAWHCFKENMLKILTCLTQCFSLSYASASSPALEGEWGVFSGSSEWYSRCNMSRSGQIMWQHCCLRGSALATVIHHLHDTRGREVSSLNNSRSVIVSQSQHNDLTEKSKVREGQCHISYDWYCGTILGESLSQWY